MNALRTGLSLLTLLALAGCASGSAGMRAVREHLDPEAAEYVILSGAEARNKAERSIADLEQALWDQSKTPGFSLEQRNLLQATFCEGRMFAKLLGLGYLQGIGYSSGELKDKRNQVGFIHNRIFLAIPPETPGFLNEFSARKPTLKAEAELGELPADTDYAIVADVVPQALLTALHRSGQRGEKLFSALVEFTIPAEEFTGVWKLVKLSRANGEEADYILQLPDPKGKLGRIRELTGDLIPEKYKIVPGKGTVTIYSSADAEKIMTSPDTPRLRERRDFQTILTGIRERKTVFCCFQNYHSTLWEDVADVKLHVSRPLPALIAVTRTDDGFLILGNGGMSLLELLTRAAINLTPPEAETNEEEDEPKAVPVKEKQPEPEPDAAAILKTVAGAPHRSVKPGMAGLRECFGGKLPPQLLRDPAGKEVQGNCRVAYFGRSEKGDLPLAVSAPQAKGEEIHVLFNSGEIERFELKDPGSCRRIISFLQTRKKWDESVWQQLMKLAEKLDSDSAE